jgi:hypothetical protein
MGTPLAARSPLGKSMETFAAQLAARAVAPNKKVGAQLN